VYVEGRLQTRSYEDRDGVKRYVRNRGRQRHLAWWSARRARRVPGSARVRQGQ
jgi:hypothetical protein